jgi:Raf kinase inhibitor-like YbhB/YbcL family protein
MATVAACASAGASPTGTATAPASAAAATAAATATATAATATEPPSPTPTAAASQTGEPKMPFTLTSTAFREGGAIPRKFSCDGADVSPTLDWAGAPDGAKALALIVDDPDARGFVHWVVFDMTASRTGGLAEGISASPDAPPQGRNDFGKVGWGGPCPPSGTHHYRFTLLALDRLLDLTGAARAADVRRAADGHVLGQAVLHGTYKRA